MPDRFLKDPDATLDYKVDWTDWLQGTSPIDTISSSTWTAVDSGITIDSSSNTTLVATVQLSGGSAGSSYRLMNQITTAAARVDQRTITVYVVDK